MSTPAAPGGPPPGRSAPRGARPPRDLFLDRELEVLEIGVRPPARLPAVLHAAAEAFPYLTYYDADIPLPQRYVLARGIFPVALCQVEHDDDHRLRAITTLDTPWEIDYRLPPLRAMSLYLVNRHGEVVEGDPAALDAELNGRPRGDRASHSASHPGGHPGGDPEEDPEGETLGPPPEATPDDRPRGDRNPSLGAERNPAHARRGTRQAHADLVVEV